MRHEQIQNILKAVVILFLGTLVSYVFFTMGIRIENIIMVYLVAVLFIVIETRSLLWGIGSSFLSILTFNFFFTDPKLTLMIEDPNYVITIIIFFIVAFLASSLMSKLQMHVQASRLSEQRTYALYQIGRGYLNVSGIDAIIHYHIRDLYKYQHMKSVLYYYDETIKELKEFRDEQMAFGEEPQMSVALYCFTSCCDCGKDTSLYEHTNWRYHPIRKGNYMLGVYAVYEDRGRSVHRENTLFLDTMVSQLVMALERERLYEAQEQTKIEVEKEKLRNNLLRSVSHDLRTPLTSISGNSSLLLERYHDLDTVTILGMVKDIDEDANWLSALVENLLNMTRIQDGKLILKRQKEVVDDILCEVSARAERMCRKHTLHIHMPKQVLLVEMDAQLIVQVILNLIDNACKHTPEGSTIDVEVYEEGAWVRFEVRDNGLGIAPHLANTIFESFVTNEDVGSDTKRGVGLGLSIAKAIIEAHGGEIAAHNQQGGGAVFNFTLRKESGEENKL